MDQAGAITESVQAAQSQGLLGHMPGSYGKMPGGSRGCPPPTPDTSSPAKEDMRAPASLRGKAVPLPRHLLKSLRRQIEEIRIFTSFFNTGHLHFSLHLFRLFFFSFLS